MISSRTAVRVRYADTDQMRMVYYGKFFEYFEQGRSDLLRDIGMPYPEIERLGYFLPVIEAYARYLHSARYDDLLTVTTMLKERPQVRVRIEYQVHNEHNELLAEGHTIHSFVRSETGKPARAPREFLDIVGRRFGASPSPA